MLIFRTLIPDADQAVRGAFATSSGIQTSGRPASMHRAAKVHKFGTVEAVTFKFPIKSRIFYLPSQHPPERDLRVMVTTPKLKIMDKHEMLEELRYNKAAAEAFKLACLA